MIDLGSKINSNTALNDAKDALSTSAASRRQLATQSNKDNQKTSSIKSQTRSNDKKFSDVLDKKVKPAVDTKSPSRAINDRSDSTEEAKASESSPKEPSLVINSDKPATRQAAMEIFLDKMESQLGVEPEAVIAAFDKLSLSELVGPPEESAEKVISQLNLSDVNAKKALGLYNEMLAMTAAAGMSQYLNKSNQEAQFQVINKKDAELKELRGNIGDMSDRFFMTGMHMPMQQTGLERQAKISEAYAAQMQMGKPTQSYISENQQIAEGQNNNISELSAASAASAEAAATDSIASSSSASGFDISGMQSVSPAEISPMDVSSLKASQQLQNAAASEEEMIKAFESADENYLDALDPNIIKADAGPNLNTVASPELMPKVDVSALKTSGSAADAATNTLNSAPAVGGATSGDKGIQDDSDSQDEKGDLEASKNDNVLGQHSSIKNAGAKPFIIGAPKPSEADVQNNVKEIISQAQFLAKKGGGEMKISLNPEGMGEVNLKVKMHNGQVNVEMITANDEAKKILEKGLGELKDSLAVHKLHLDSIKIDSTKETSHHLEQQMKDQESGFQQRFLSDFRDRNQSLKREMLEFGAPSVPMSQTRDRAASSQYNAANKKRSDRRLDLVA
jgi:flagellar hook-length control protein FliK